MFDKIKHILISAALLFVAECPAYAAEPDALHPVIAPGRAILVGTVNVAQAAVSRSNAQAYAALRAAKPVPVRAHLLPNGYPAVGAVPAAATLMRFAPNTRVSASSGPVSISGFTGIYDGVNAAATGGELEPPDQGLAVNNGVVGEIVNNTLQFFRNGVALTAPLNNAVFFNSGTVANLSDPHITFDPSVQRWFVDELTYSGPLGYGFFLAVSKTSDPTGEYYIYFIPSAANDVSGCGKAGCLPDFPQVGYDANGFYITADLFGPKQFVSAVVYALPKSELVFGNTIAPIRFLLPDFVVQPAVPAPGEPFSLANGGTEFFMTARNLYDGSTKIRLWQIRNTFNIVTAPGSLVAVKKDFNAEPYTGTVPSTQPDLIGPYGRSQRATSAPKLDGGYNAFSANVKIAHSHLYAALTTGAVDGNGLKRDNIAWFDVNVSGPTAYLEKQGYIVAPNGYSISYPGLALDRTGNGFIGVSITNPNQKLPGGFPSTAIVPFGPTGGRGAITVTGVGARSDDGFTGYGSPGSPGRVGRWGDFASAVIDATTGIYYTANEFIPDPAVYPRGTFANWGTFITSVHK